MIILIILYTLLVLVQLSLDDTNWVENKNYRKSFFSLELVILGIFVIDIAMHSYAWGSLYLKDIWTIFDIIVIILSIVFVFLDLTI